MVVVIEDDAAMRDTIACVLLDSGCDVAVSSNGVSGLRAVHDRHPEVVVLDLRLPELDGVQVLLNLRSMPEGLHTDVVIVSATRELMPDCLRSQCRAILHKPFEIDDLVAAVSHGVRRQRLDHVRAHPGRS